MGQVSRQAQPAALQLHMAFPFSSSLQALPICSRCVTYKKPSVFKLILR